VKVGDIVKRNPKYFSRCTYPEYLGVVIMTDERLQVTSNCVKVMFPDETTQYRISMLELVSASR